MLPFKAESNESLRARYHKAFSKVWDAVEIEQNHKANRPGLDPNCIFDFESGIRLLISYIRVGNVITKNLSASWDNDGLLLSYKSFSEATKDVERHFVILDSMHQLRWLGMSPGKGIPHWLIVEKPEFSKVSESVQ